MKKINFNKYIDVFCPFYTENLWHIIVWVKNKNPEINNVELKKEVLNILNYLLENKILFIIDEIIL